MFASQSKGAGGTRRGRDLRDSTTGGDPTHMHPGEAFRTIKTTSQRKIMRVVAALLTTALAAGALMLGGVPAAIAAAGDFTVTLDGPATVQVGSNYNYTATVDFEGVNSGNPATGVVLTTTLPEGTTFVSVPSGDSSPVLSHTYDPATRVLSMTLKDTTQDLLSVVYTVAQVEREKKYEGFPLDTAITGSGGPSGTVTSAPVHSTVTGTNDYQAKKGYQVLTGGDNRTVTYKFDMCSLNPTTDFSAYSQVLTDVFPSGAVLVAASTNVGSWNTTAWPTAVWTNTTRFDPTSGNCLDPSFSNIWITVRYPSTVAGWEEGQLPPANTVTLKTTDANGVVHDGLPATTQAPPLGGGAAGAFVAIDKTSGDYLSAGALGRTTNVSASYIAGPTDPNLDALIVTDSGAAGGGAEDWYHHNDVLGLAAVFNSTLSAQNLPYTVEYQTDYSSTWQSFTPVSPTTGTDLQLTVQNTGSINWSGPRTNNVLNLPVGSVLTGWRVVIAPGAETVPAGSEVRLTMGSQPVYRDITEGVVPVGTPAGTSPGPVNNTATVSNGTGSLTAQDSDAYTPKDSVYLTTNIRGPGVLTVGDSGTYRAGIVNQNPSETYTDAKMSVVLPCGVLYDATSPITPVTPVPIGAEPIPAIGSGVSVDTTARVTDADGCEQQVVTFTFDQITPMRAPGEASDRRVELSGWQYDIPVKVLAQAYHPADTSVPVESYVYTGDPRFLSVADGGTGATTVPMIGYGPFFSTDTYNFDPSSRNQIAKWVVDTTINTAGGLLMGKLSSATADGPWALDTPVDTEAFWQIYVSNVLPNPVTGMTLFDMLPTTAAGDEFGSVLSGPVTGAPAGATIEYSTDAVDATSGTWTTDPVNATAFRIVLDSMASGEEFTLIVPTTILGDPVYGQSTHNVASATGTYNGSAVQFESNKASVSLKAAPAMTLVKKTNGTAYDAAPGATVATGSEVTWTYEVTNTGNTPLDTINVNDVYSAGDGSTGSLVPTTTETGPLAPGATRTYTATGTAIAGQYHNTATASGTVVSSDGNPLPEQPAAVTDESWYLAGSSGLTIVKTTNGMDVESAPGPQLNPGSEVTWAYTVTNTGDLVLTDVLVIDKDSAGNTVFTQTVPSLEPGESTTLSATGTAVVGQYHNTVTATAANPDGGTALAAADDSFYFGGTPGVKLTKLVSISADGPWTKKVTISSGATVYWQLSVTNTGSIPLTDLQIDDPSLGEVEPVASLAPGETVTRVIAQHNVTSSYTNTATVNGKDLEGKTSTSTDTAEVSIEGGTLAYTGAVGMAVALLGGLLLLGGGGAALAATRRRRAG